LFRHPESSATTAAEADADAARDEAFPSLNEDNPEYGAAGSAAAAAADADMMDTADTNTAGDSAFTDDGDDAGDEVEADHDAAEALMPQSQAGTDDQHSSMAVEVSQPAPPAPQIASPAHPSSPVTGGTAAAAHSGGAVSMDTEFDQPSAPAPAASGGAVGAETSDDDGTEEFNVADDADRAEPVGDDDLQHDVEAEAVNADDEEDDADAADVGDSGDVAVMDEDDAASDAGAMDDRQLQQAPAATVSAPIVISEDEGETQDPDDEEDDADDQQASMHGGSASGGAVVFGDEDVVRLIVLKCIGLACFGCVEDNGLTDTLTVYSPARLVPVTTMTPMPKGHRQTIASSRRWPMTRMRMMKMHTPVLGLQVAPRLQVMQV